MRAGTTGSMTEIIASLGLGTIARSHLVLIQSHRSSGYNSHGTSVLSAMQVGRGLGQENLFTRDSLHSGKDDWDCF